MITIRCPWCEEDAALAFPVLADPAAEFTCPDCGTSVVFSDESAEPLDVAA